MKKIKMLGFFVVGIVTGLVLLVGIARLSWHTKFYPGVTVAGINVAGLTREQARVRLNSAISDYQIKLTFNGSHWETPREIIMVDMENSLNEAYRYGRRVKIEDYLLLLINKKNYYPIVIAEKKTDKLESLINEITATVEIPPIDPSIEVTGKIVKVINGTDGTVLDAAQLYKNIEENYRWLKSSPVEVPTSSSARQLDKDQLDILKNRAENLITKDMTLVLDDEKIKLSSKEVIALLATSGKDEVVDKLMVSDYATGLGESLDKQPQDARFQFVDGKVIEFSPGKDGVKISEEVTGDRLKDGIEKLLTSEDKSINVEIAVTRTPPKITTEKVNELGLKERIGRGESYYAHSIPNRIYNVGLASERANSAIVPPGEEFSFNESVGEVSGATGYRPAYVISGGRTVLGDGGGLCQVSTTAFRAAMNAGLPITERWAHAYRVGYYEQNSKPGIDATVYAPSKDLKFRNDTPGHILIQYINDPKNLHLVVEIYGTNDGRVATVSEPKLWGITPALPTIYQDDPSLPSGTTKQVDWAASGAKTSFEYKVVKDEITLQEKTFTSNYRSWASVYLRGTGI